MRARDSVIVESGTRLDARHLAILAASGISSLRETARPGRLAVGRRRAPRRGREPGARSDPRRQRTDAAGAPGRSRRSRSSISGCSAMTGPASPACCTRRPKGSISSSVRAASRAAMPTMSPRPLPMQAGRRALSAGTEPGKPLLAGKIGSTPMVGLPGNPVAALVNFMLFVRPLLDVWPARGGGCSPARLPRTRRATDCPPRRPGGIRAGQDRRPDKGRTSADRRPASVRRGAPAPAGIVRWPGRDRPGTAGHRDGRSRRLSRLSHELCDLSSSLAGARASRPAHVIVSTRKMRACRPAVRHDKRFRRRIP